MTTTPLPLHAEFLLLAHDPETGKALVDGTPLKAALAGAALIELGLQEAVRLEGEGRDARLVATDADVSPELVEVLARADGHAPKKAVARMGGAESYTDRATRLREATWDRLESERLVRRDEDKVLGLFPVTRRIQTTAARSTLVDTLRSAVLGSEPPGIRTVGLVSVAQASGVLAKVLPEVDKKHLKARAKEIGEGTWGGDAVAKAVADMQAALMTAIMVPVIVSAGAT